MKNITKKIIAVFAVLCVAATCFAGCSEKNNSESVSAPKQYPFSWGSAGEANALSIDDPNADLEADDLVINNGSSETGNSETAEPATEIQDVTDEAGEPVTEIVEVTEADGQPATDASGEKVTEVVKVTQIVTKPSTGGNTQTSTQASEGNNSSASDYKPAKDGRYAMWLDISKDENFFFEDAMIKAQFKVKEGIPDGDYKIQITPDLSDVAGVAIYPEKVIDGIVRVNNGEIEAVDVSNETGMIFYGDNIACKQGDTFDFNVNIKNNIGMVAFVIWIYFDSNAFEFVDAAPTGEFADISMNTDIGQANIKDE